MVLEQPRCRAGAEMDEMISIRHDLLTSDHGGGEAEDAVLCLLDVLGNADGRHGFVCCATLRRETTNKKKMV